MKVSVSLSERDIARLDRVVAEDRAENRSAAVQLALRLLEESTLERDYELAADDWESSGDARAWASTETDGLAYAAW